MAKESQERNQIALDYGPVQTAIDELTGTFGSRLSVSSDVRERFGKDESFHPSIPPDAVIAAHSTEEVSDIVRVCARHRVPVIPYGTGTSLEGHVAALHGGICINLLEMHDVLTVHAEDLDVVVQPGVTRKQLITIYGTRAFSFRSIQAPMLPSGEWRPGALPDPMRFDMGPCERTCWR